MPRQRIANSGDMQHDLQAMLHLLRPQDTVKMAVRLESALGTHSRYMVVVCAGERREAAVLGVDRATGGSTSIGLVLPVWASTRAALDGDGGISVESASAQHLFKPVSVQAMWSAFQCLHKENATARDTPCSSGGLTHAWLDYYESRLDSPEAFRSEWHYTFADDSDLKADGLERFREKPAERAAAEKLVRAALKGVMQSVDLDQVTSKDIRQRLEDRLDLDLTEYKEFIDQEMLVILGQMDKPSQIFPYLYLGTEWNASNWDELRQNNVAYILNVTKEVDNFFPGLFNYMKIRVSDEESTELLKHWDLTYKFIAKAKETNCAVLVHCKKGISRSSSTVIAYAMKAYNLSLEYALNFVKEKRDCITPNKGFMEQLKTYNGILDASRHRKSSIFNQLPVPPMVRPASSPQLECPPTPADWPGDFFRVVESAVSFDGEQLLSPLVVASENILKSCDTPTFAFLADSAERRLSSALDSLDLGDERLPRLAERPPVQRQLAQVGQRMGDQQDALTLRRVQQILMRHRQRAPGAADRSCSSSGTSSMESESSSLGSTTSDDDAAPTAPRPVRKSRRNSKSSAGGSTGDSAIVDMGAVSVDTAAARLQSGADVPQLQLQTVAEDRGGAQGDVSPRSADAKRAYGRKLFDKFFRSDAPRRPASEKWSPKWYQDVRRRANTDRAPPKTADSAHAKLAGEHSSAAHERRKISLRGAHAGKVKHQKEKLEQLSNRRHSGGESSLSRARLLLTHEKATVKRLASNLERRSAGGNGEQACGQTQPAVAADGSNSVRSLVGVFETPTSGEARASRCRRAETRRGSDDRLTVGGQTNPLDRRKSGSYNHLSPRERQHPLRLTKSELHPRHYHI